MTTGERIRKRRQELGLTQEELANKLGNKSRASVCTVENGKEDLTTTRIRQYAEALECSPAYLMGWTNEENLPLHQEEKISSYSSHLLDESKDIIDRYEHLPEEKKSSFRNYLKFLESDS